MELKSIEVKNFKRISHIPLELDSVNILVGENGSGKSSVLQGIHLASCVIRQAERVKLAQSAQVSIDELDYLPSNNYKSLGHYGLWGNKVKQPGSEFSFAFESNGLESTTRCTLRAARNQGISITGEVHPSHINLLRAKAKFFSAYSPGISGIPNLEEKRTEKLVKKACSFGDSNAILRNVLDLLRTNDPQSISQIEEWMASVVGPIRILIDHNPARDAVISASAEVNNHIVPLELLGTGYLQLIQIFAYILLLRPRILLLDEPDTHLNPKVQEQLVPLLAEIASKRNIKVLMTTHSPFIVRGGTLNANVAWLSDGQVVSSDSSRIQAALGWGAMGKKILIKTEDNNITMLTKILAQWPDLERQVAIIPGEGFKTLPSPKQAAEFLEAMGETFLLVIHRDRDCLTSAEADKLRKDYEDAGAHLWLTKYSDIESYFVSPAFLAEFLGVAFDEAETLISSICTKQHNNIVKTFFSQRAEINKQMYPEGGSPVNSVVEAEIKTDRGVFGITSGKAVLKALSNEKLGVRFDISTLLRSQLNCEIAGDLRLLLESILRIK